MCLGVCSLIFISLCGFIFFIDHAQASSRQEDTSLENLIQQSVSQGYHEDFIDLVEMIYGKGFLSQGGTISIEHMVRNVAIENRKILDVGSGLGGLVLYLAEQYPIDITGLEPQKWLFTKAMANLKEKTGLLKGSAQFILMDHPAHLNQFPDESFDIILSKESILHVPLEIKKAFFLEIARVLKPGGQIVIMDWMRTVAQYSQKTQKMMDMDGVAYHLITPSDYQSMLKDVGFSHVQMEDVSQETANFSQGNIDKIRELVHIIQEKYGRDVYEYCIESWGYQRDAFASKELVAGIFRAKKRCAEKSAH